MMDWFNVYGLIFMAIVMIPNIVFAVRNKDGFGNKWHNRTVEILEQAGRYGCFAFMVINIPGTFLGWGSDKAFTAYMVVDSVLVLAYCICWIVMWNSRSRARALALSVLPSVLFLFSGIMCRSVLLILSAALFAPMHIFISYRNAC